MLRRFSAIAYSVMRIVVGFLFACHGAQKLFGALGGHADTHDPKMLIAGVIEFFGGILIALGIFASIAAFIACGEMAVAYFTAHAPHGFWPIVNRGEPAVLYCFLFLFIMFEGDGRWSLGALWHRRSAPSSRLGVP
jgi:putative oxidoreductase